eukprot:3564690-Rhodomonas_salina.1
MQKLPGSALRRDVLAFCRPTPYAYKRAVAAADGEQPVCSHCVEWFNQLTRGKTRDAEQACVIPMDSLLAFMLSPDAANMPDTRNMGRLFTALTHSEHGLQNPFLSMPQIDDLVSVTLLQREGDPVQNILAAWWELNWNCEVFKCAQNCALVRRLVSGPDL